jgi:hypothetical protein
MALPVLIKGLTKSGFTDSTHHRQWQFSLNRKFNTTEKNGHNESTDSK